jgi:YbbR domain-containing protein
MMSFFRHLFLRDFGLKLFSLFLAVLIWLPISFAIQQQSSPMGALGLAPKSRTFSNLPIVVVSSTLDARQFKATPSEVQVTVQGHGAMLENLQNTEIRAMVVFTGTEAGPDTAKKVEVSTPPGITCTKVVPAEVQIKKAE